MADYITWFRDSTPYISAHRDKTFVVLLPSEAIAHPELTNTVHDLALLHVLGVRLVVVHGSRTQVDQELSDSAFVRDRRITDEATMRTITRVNGEIRTQLEALFSMGLPATPMHNTDISVVSGNFVTAKPIGVIDGHDHAFTGQVRKVHGERISAALDSGALVLMPPIGYSPSGQAFNLAAHELAGATAVALGADKLIALDERPYLTDADGNRIGSTSPAEASRVSGTLPEHAARVVELLCDAVSRGVNRAHVLAYAESGVLLKELFTAQGVGTQVTEDKAGQIRKATGKDVADIVEVIRPLEESGALVRRSRDRLEEEIGHFYVAEVDGIVVGTCALYAHESLGELACLAVKPSFQANQSSLNIGTRLVQTVETAARKNGLQQLFVLTTQAEDWFREQGYQPDTLEALPVANQQLYNYQRASKVMTKNL